MRLGGRHNMPPPRDLDFWPFDLEVGVGVACDLGYPCAKFRLPRPFGLRVRVDVRDIRQTDGQTDRRTTDADHRLMSPPPTGRGHNKSYSLHFRHCRLSTRTDDTRIVLLALGCCCPERTEIVSVLPFPKVWKETIDSTRVYSSVVGVIDKLLVHTFLHQFPNLVVDRV